MANPTIRFKRGTQSAFASVGLQTGEPAFITDELNFYIGIDGNSANNKFFGSHRYWKKETASKGSGINLVEATGGSDYVTLAAPASVGAAVTYYFPATQGATSSVLTNDGSGNLTWASGSANPVFTGIATFSDTTDNTLGNPDTGAVQIDGGLGINKNVTIGAGLSVAGESYFIGTATFYGGQINLGDSDGDNISVAGEFVSNLVPNATNTYDLGLTGKRWRNGYYSGNVDITGNLTVDGNVTVGGGTTVILYGQDVFIKNKDIILGYTTSITNEDASTDDTANHAGVAIASTVGSPLTSFAASGINTLPDTYKQMMWFHAGTLGFGTDAFAFNYGVAIGTTNMANGVRLAVGTGVTVSDTSVSATNFYGALSGNASSADQVKTITASDTNATYHITFVDSHNGSATNETVYTDDGIYYNPGANKLTTQHAEFTGNVLVSGISTLAGNVFLGDSGSDLITVVGVTTFTTSNVYIDNQLFVGGLQITGGAVVGQDITTRHLAVSGISTFTGAINANGNVTLGDTSGDTIIVKGTATFEQPVVGTIGTATRAASVDVVGVATNQNYYITLVDSSGTSKSVGVDSELLYNPNNNTFTVGTGVGITQFSSAVGSGTSTSSVPTSSAVIDYVNAADIGIAGDSGTGTVNTTQTLTVNGTANEIETSASGQTITVGLPDAVVVGTSLSAPTVRANIIQSQNTGATAITIAANDVTIADDLTVNGNLYVNGNTTQVNTTALTVEDRTIELGVVDGTTTSTTTWDLGVLFNYGDAGTARKSAVIWEHGDSRFKFAKILDSDTNGANANTPQLTVNTFAPIEIGELWVNNACTGGSNVVIGCSGGELQLQNVVVDGGSF